MGRGAEAEAVIAWWTRIAPSPPPDDGTRPLHPVVLPQIRSPSATASSELFPRLRPPGAKAAAALVPFRRAPNFIVDEDLSRRRRLFRCQPITVHQVSRSGSFPRVPRPGCQRRAEFALWATARAPRGQLETRAAPCPVRAKRASRFGDSGQGLQGLWRRLQRAARPLVCVASCG
jgi:hypothetical protein